MNVSEAFAGLKSNLEITAAEQGLAAKRHARIREHIRSRWALTDDFLTGSYRRHTKTKRLTDVDIFVVIDPNGPQGDLIDGTGTAALDALADVLSTSWTVETDANVVRIRYADEDVASYEIAPAFAAASGYRIPNGASWMRTDPKVHAELVSAKNAACGDRFVPFVKMIKRINRHSGDPIQPSFLLEVMGLALVEPPFLTYPEEIRYFLASAADTITQDWPDPAGLGDSVNAGSTASDRAVLSDVLRGWLEQAEYAIRLEQSGRDGAAVAAWRELFGARMPS